MAKHNKSMAVKTGVSPTKERRRHNGGVVSDIIDRDMSGKALVKRYRAKWECPLDVYKDNRLIDGSEYRAGLRFREAYFTAVLSRGAAAERLNPQPVATGLTMSERIVQEAYRVLPSYNKGVIIDICGHDQMMWNPKALEKLRKGLGHLALRWNMAAMEVCDHKIAK